MKPFPVDAMQQHARFIDALTQDWLDAGTVTRVTPRADRVLEIARQVNERNVRILLGEDSLWAAVSCPTSLRSPEPVPVSAHSGDGQGRKGARK